MKEVKVLKQLHKSKRDETSDAIFQYVIIWLSTKNVR